MQDLGRPNKPGICADISIIAAAFVNGQFYVARILKLIENLETAAAAFSLNRVA